MGIALHHPVENPNPNKPTPLKARATTMINRLPYRSDRTPINGLINPFNEPNANNQLNAVIDNPNPDANWGDKRDENSVADIDNQSNKKHQTDNFKTSSEEYIYAIADCSQCI